MTGIRLIPIYLHFEKLGYTPLEIQELTLRQIEDILNEEPES